MPIFVPADPPSPTPARTSVGTLPNLTLSRGEVILPLNYSTGLEPLPGVEGLDEPPRRIITADPATWDGSQFRDVFYAPRDVFVPLSLVADNTDDMRATLRTLATLLDPKRGPVTLTVAHADGTLRDITGYTSQPMGQALDVGEGRWWRRIGVTLRCPDPFWYGPQQTATFRGPTDATHFLGQLLPLQLGTSQVSDVMGLDNRGDAEAYPVWTVTGPGTSLTVALGDLAWSMPAGVDDGETVVVDTRRGRQSVNAEGVNGWPRLSRGSVLWAIPPFDPAQATAASVTMAGATSASRVVAAWSSRWLTAW